MRKLIIVALILNVISVAVSVNLVGQQGMEKSLQTKTLVEQFKNPPPSARPGVLWDWMSSRIKELAGPSFSMQETDPHLNIHPS